MSKARETPSFRVALRNCCGRKEAFDDSFHALFAVDAGGRVDIDDKEARHELAKAMHSLADAYDAVLQHVEESELRWAAEKLRRAAVLLGVVRGIDFDPDVVDRAQVEVQKWMRPSSRRRALASARESKRWISKSEAASEAGITLETLRGWCNRKRNPLQARWVGGKQLVNLADVLRERDAKGRGPAQRSPTLTPNALPSRRKRPRKA